MPRRKPEEWIELQEAAAIMSTNNGRKISADYVRLLAHKNHIAMKPKDGRQNLYLKSDVEVYKVRQKKKITQDESQPAA
jgi:hypothetical protein